MGSSLARSIERLTAQAKAATGRARERFKALLGRAKAAKRGMDQCLWDPSNDWKRNDPCTHNGAKAKRKIIQAKAKMQRAMGAMTHRYKKQHREDQAEKAKLSKTVDKLTKTQQ